MKKYVMKSCVLMSMMALIVGLGSEAYGKSKVSRSALKTEKAGKKEKRTKSKEAASSRRHPKNNSSSKLSLSTKISYRGGTIENFLGRYRPPITGSPYPQTSLLIGPSLDYRLSPGHSLTLDGEFHISTPLQGDVDQNNSQFVTADPTLNYSSSYSLGRFQASTSLGYIPGLSDASKEYGIVSLSYLSQNLITSNASGLTMGLTSTYIYFQWESSKISNRSVDWFLQFRPFLEYPLNDMSSFRAVFSWFNFYKTHGAQDDSLWTMSKGTRSQSLGVSLSLSKNVLLYPNIQFLPFEWDIRDTNLGINATINIF